VSATRRGVGSSSFLAWALIGVALGCAATKEPASPVLDVEPSAVKPDIVAVELVAAERFAILALDCVQREYPNKIAHVLDADADARPPRELTPSFYGCFDWHSAVHGHWLLVRLLKRFPDGAFAPRAREVLLENLDPARVAVEVEYLARKGREGFERPYGLAWLLTLALELREWDEPLAMRLALALEPLEKLAVVRLAEWFPKLSHPIRTGEHFQTAFAMGLILDYARGVGNAELEKLVVARARDYYAQDVACPLAYEPSGQDFLSPCIAEADLMRRVLPAPEFAAWLERFLPQVPRSGEDGDGLWLDVAVVTDASDGKLAHLDGLNLSRAWMLEGIGFALDDSDPRRGPLLAAAARQGRAGIAAVTGEHYEGGHWLATFAVYLVTRRGINPP
jgi:hypothetical protein